MNKLAKLAVIVVAPCFVLAPVVFLVLASLSPGASLSISFSGLTWEAYAAVLGTSSVVSSIGLTCAVSAVVAILTVMIALPAAYAFARVDFKWSSFLSNSLLSAWLLPQVFVALAFFSLAIDVGLYGNPLAMIFFGLIQSIPLSIWVLRSFVAEIPRDLDEAAFLDGAGLTTYFARILLPLAAPSIAAAAGYAFLLTWQMYLYPLIYLAGSGTQMASVGVSNFVGQWSTNYPQMMAYSVLITAPIVAIFLFIQRCIVSGLTAGAVNG